MPGDSQYTAFYPQNRIYIMEPGETLPEFNTPYPRGEIFKRSWDTHELRVTRYGKIMLQVREFESAPLNFGDFDKGLATVGKYLDHLNALYLLLSSAAIEVDRFVAFKLYEITTTDIFRVRYEGERLNGQGIPSESIASVYQAEEWTAPEPSPTSPFLPPRAHVSAAAISRGANDFAAALLVPGLVPRLASFAKALTEFKAGNFETSVVLSWFLVESALRSLWNEHLNGRQRKLPDGGSRINAKRRELLTGRDMTMSIVSNLLELLEIVSFDELKELDFLRKLRNDVAHQLGATPKVADAERALLLAQRSIAMVSGGFSFTADRNLGFQW